MSTTTSHTPPESEGQSDGTACGAGVRPARLIQNEATTEIPVHLLFRDGPDPVRVPLAPALVGRRQDTGERPRPGHPVPVRRRPLPETDPGLAERPAR
ncbi:SPFH domain-containing protein, partial [Streptomyces sp. CSDS2]|nr:SPFH domain-containing protein [Streptomyces sp. CSDS2]